MLQAYYVFSIGNIKHMITFEYPDCWKFHHQGCTKPLVQSPEYTQICGEATAPSLCRVTGACAAVSTKHTQAAALWCPSGGLCFIHYAFYIGCMPCAGIIIGMLLFGAIGDLMGRRLGSICTACTMLLGAAMLTAQDGATPKGFTVFYIISQFVFGWASPSGALDPCAGPRRERCRKLACTELAGGGQPTAQASAWRDGPQRGASHQLTYSCGTICRALVSCVRGGRSAHWRRA